MIVQRQHRDPSTMRNAVAPAEEIPPNFASLPVILKSRMLFAKAQDGDLKGFKLLHEQDKPMINFFGPVRETVLHHAVKSHNWELCEYIIGAGCSPFFAASLVPNEPRWSAFDFSLHSRGPLFSIITKKPHSTYSECSICMETRHLYPLECGHSFCYNCLKSWLLTSVKEQNYCVCPDRQCQVKLENMQDIKFFVEDLFDAYFLQKSRRELSSLPGFMWCQFCTFGFFIDLDSDEKCKSIECNNCNTSMCTGCKWRAHDGDCEENRIRFVELRTQQEELCEIWKINNTKQCPRCRTSIQKNEGCSHMKCLICKYEFCWVCLGLYTFSASPRCNCR
eukprot:TRINITY_DN5149_c0_g2_i1.p1 TRINITY_DN5149_c0_g2~~TRINITY_DN5149_c0_g2_i1.p1  ORF type:complete len:335 (-),score=7.77 TRINITY_DN5149_c0_g2_i1:90-1094(-)